ncbi:MAG: hydroxylamine reductase [Desulfovibrio sp.]|nr:hydroxylamine reductase [Desulfovibrio sp.]
MFCDQCEQTARGTGCTVMGVCGKDNEVALEQDQLVYLLRRLAFLVEQAKDRIDATPYDDFIADALFATLTNVNFDPKALHEMQATAFEHCRNLAAQTGETPDDLKQPLDDYLKQLPETKVGLGTFSADRDVDSAMQMLLFGLKGLCAYKDHAARLNQRDADLSAFVRKALIAGSQWDDQTRDLGGWLEIILECGKGNLKAMELLDAGNTGHFGDPEPSKFSLGHRKGKCILISGHDLLDLEELLKQTEGTGINIYTHGEMLPAHGYPKLKAYKHLAGNFGTAWENQQKEFPNFPGPIIMTTNCLQNPKSYGEHVFTTQNVGWPGCKHVHGRDFSEVIKMAQAMPGFADDDPGKQIMTGFGRKTLHDAAPAILDAVSQGKLKHIFLVGGCDGARPTRKYYTEFVEMTPKDTVVLTLACGKFRFYDKDLGMLGDFPRYMDCGQCNDAYTAIKTAVALADALKCSVNDLPLSMIISWYEQKAVAVLLTLLSLGVQNIILGPTLPAFVSPAILKIITEKFGLRLMTTPEEDLKTCLNRGKAA